MNEQYDVAAWRHHNVAELLETFGEIDDAGYHFGVCGENSVKYALVAGGLKATWIAAGAAVGKTPFQSLINTPLRGHFPNLKSFIRASQTEIALYAKGRWALALTHLVLHPSFAKRFDGWDINIRYADSTHCPVAPAICLNWHKDADDLILGLVIWLGRNDNKISR